MSSQKQKGLIQCVRDIIFHKVLKERNCFSTLYLQDYCRVLLRVVISRTSGRTLESFLPTP